DWGIGVWNPLALKKKAFRPFRDLLRANMIEDGYLRLDHVMWLFRLFWVHPDAGTYVYYPYRELTALLCLESHLHRCTVIGEDLGTVPDEIEDILRKRHMLSWKVLFFERNADGSLCETEGYPNLSVATLNTHDLPTWNGYWLGVDILDRKKCKRFRQEEDAAAALEERKNDRNHILRYLLDQKVVEPATAEKLSSLAAHAADFAEGNEEMPSDSELVTLSVAIHRALARSSSRLVLVSMNDLTGDLHQPNMPGTVDQYPNWKILSPLSIEQLGKGKYYRAITDAVMEERAAPSGEKTGS
ncbi:MAG TPA: hypothetical protein DEA96_07680, partial [Leptospiraceae bacterium]|nr:hypothetical protein [Leptospiraceae bacterium]